jgi:hypothetical protein
MKIFFVVVLVFVGFLFFWWGAEAYLSYGLPQSFWQVFVKILLGIGPMILGGASWYWAVCLVRPRH